MGINFEYDEDGSIKLSQPHLIDDILKQTHIAERHLAKATPAMSSKILHRHEQEESFNNRFHYRSVGGKLNYLDKGTRPDISYAAHQCARHSQDPKKSHEEAILHLAKHLKGTRNNGLILKPNSNRSIDIHVDAEFCGNFNPNTSSEDVSTAKSRTGYVISFAGCPVTWDSKLKTNCLK